MTQSSPTAETGPPSANRRKFVLPAWSIHLDGLVAPRLEVKDVRARLNDPAGLCAELGLVGACRRQLNGVMIACPWHDDSTPSCSVSLAESGTIRVKCFGCGVAGDALTLIARALDLDLQSQFQQILVEADRIASVLPITRLSPVVPAPTGPRVSSTDAVAKAVFDACPVRDGSEVAKYLAGRRLLAAAQRDGWGELRTGEEQVALYARLVSEFGRMTASSVGIFDEEGRVRFKDHSLLIPWRNEQGEIATIQRRLVCGGVPNVPKYVFPRDVPATVPYGIERLAEADPKAPITLVEGAVDVLAYRALAGRSESAGVVLGLPGVAPGRSRAMPWARGRVCRIGFDADEAGHRASKTLCDLLLAAGAIRVTRLLPNDGKDWAEALERWTL